MSDIKKKITLGHRLEYAGVLTLVFLFRLMPLETASALMGRLWRWIAPRLKRQERAMNHLRLSFPEKSEEELYQITLDMWENLGRTTAESLLTEKFVEKAKAFKFSEGFDQMCEDLLERGTGAVVVSMHSGNWELAGIISSLKGYDMCAVYQRLQNPLVDDYVVRQRASTFSGGMVAKGQRAGSRLMDAVREGKIAAIMADLRDGRGHKVDFFGRPAPSNIYPARLARQLDVPLIAVRIVRVGDMDFDVDYHVVEVGKNEDAAQDAREATEEIQKTFESWIRSRPDQWMWAHRRWG